MSLAMPNVHSHSDEGDNSSNHSRKPDNHNNENNNAQLAQLAQLARTRFTLLDIVQMLAGVLVLLLAVGKAVTGSVTWNVNSSSFLNTSPSTNPKPAPASEYWHKHALDIPRRFSAEKLSNYTGLDGRPILIAVNGTIFDVSSRPGFYGPRGAYRRFAGRDCSRSFAYTMWSMQGLREPCTNNLTGLTEEEIGRVTGWREYFEKKYTVVGWCDFSEKVD